MKRNFIAKLAVLIVVLMSFELVVAGSSPNFLDIVASQVFQVTQDELFLSYHQGIDLDNDYPLNFSLFNVPLGGFTSVKFNTYNYSWGVFNFTPTKTEIGVHTVQIGLDDDAPDDDGIVRTIYFDVANINDPPNITWYDPGSLELTMYENDSIGFSFNYSASDPDLPFGLDTLRNTYFLDGVNVSSNQTYNVTTGYCEPSNKTVLLVVEDIERLNDTLQWNITNIINVNRKPTFNLSNQFTDLEFPEDTVRVNEFALFPSRFFDLDTECTHRPDNMFFSPLGNGSMNVQISQVYPYYVSFYPEQNFFGELNITFNASDGRKWVLSNSFIVNVTPVSDAPIISLIPNQTAYAKTQFYYDVDAIDPEHGLMNFTDDSSFFDIALLTGIIDFVPSNSNTGNYTINITVTDEAGEFNSTTFVLEIKENYAPYINTISTQNVSQNSSFSLQITGGDPDSDTINFSIDYSGFLKVAEVGNSATYNFTPSINGTFTIPVNITDEHGATNYTTFLLNVSYINMAPTIYLIDPQIAKIGKEYNFTVTADDGNGGAEELTFSDNASFFNIDSSTGEIRFTPTLSDRGNHTVNISVVDNGFPQLGDWQIVDFEITYNRPPRITIDPGSQTAWEDYPFNLTIVAYDPDNDPLTFVDNTSLFDINLDSGAINFIPNFTVANATYSIKINVSDGDGGNDSIIFSLRINLTNDPPYFDPPLNESYSWENVSEGRQHLIYLNVTDEENDPITFALSWINCTQNNSCTEPFNLTILNSTPGRLLINFTPEDDLIGEYYFNLTINDLIGNLVSEVVFMNISDTNDPPYILTITPVGKPISFYTNFSWINVSILEDNGGSKTSINVSEGRRIVFNHTSNDVDPLDNDIFYVWSLDGVNISSGIAYSHFFGYSSRRVSNLTLYVYDDEGARSEFMWDISIEDINRPPIFGTKYDSDYDTLSDGTFENTSILSSGIVCLQYLNGNYSLTGSFISDIIDLEARMLLEIGYLNYSAITPPGTSLSFMTKGSENNITWTEWSDFYDPSLDTVPSGSHRYFQYKARFISSNASLTPCLEAASVNYSISNITLNNNNIYSSVLFLNDYFYDLDPTDNLTYGADSYDYLDITIEDNYNVRIEPDGDYYGEDTIRFFVSDGNSTTYSNDVDVLILQGTGAGSSSESRASSTRVLVQTQVKKEKETEYAKFKLISPSEVTVYQNESVKVPIKITNPTNETLLDITMNATSEGNNMNFTFSRKTFAELRVGETKNTTLTITPFKIAGTYEIIVSGLVRDPNTNDSVKIMVNSREKGEHNSSQINTKIAFTEDLLGSHPECLELNEILNTASEALALKQYAKAETIVNKVASDCRYLISEDVPTLEVPKTTGNVIKELLEKQGVVTWAGIGLGIVMMFGFFLLYKKT